MKITACPKCGSKDIQIGTMDSGVTFGITSWKSQCRNCGYQGEPLIFDSDEEYEEFFHQIAEEVESGKTDELKQREPMEGEDDNLTLSKKEKEVVEFLNEINKETSQQEEKTLTKVFPENKVWWPEIGVAVILSAVSFFSFLYHPSLSMDLVGTVLYGLLQFIAETFIILFAIIIIEYFVISIQNMVKRKNK